MRRDQLTQTGLARKAGVTANNVQAILTGHSKRPAADIVLPLARALGVSPDYLLSGDENEVSTVAEARERLGDLFMELMGVLNSLERRTTREGLLRVAEAPAAYKSGAQEMPVVGPTRAWTALEQLRRNGELRDPSPGEATVALVIELPDSARQSPQVRRLYGQADEAD